MSSVFDVRYNLINRENITDSNRRIIRFYIPHRPYFEFTSVFSSIRDCWFVIKYMILSHSNFDLNHPITFNSLIFSTAEHLFQSQKFHSSTSSTAPHLYSTIRLSNSPGSALRLATNGRNHQRKDWFSVNIGIMEEILWLKFTQWEDLWSLLLNTGDVWFLLLPPFPMLYGEESWYSLKSTQAELVEDSNKDSFWGVGPNKDGRNELGKALMRLRSDLRNKGAAAISLNLLRWNCSRVENFRSESLV